MITQTKSASPYIKFLYLVFYRKSEQTSSNKMLIVDIKVFLKQHSCILLLLLISTNYNNNKLCTSLIGRFSITWLPIIRISIAVFNPCNDFINEKFYNSRSISFIRFTIINCTLNSLMCIVPYVIAQWIYLHIVCMYFAYLRFFFFLIILFSLPLLSQLYRLTLFDAITIYWIICIRLYKKSLRFFFTEWC